MISECPSIPVQGCDLCLTGDSQCSSFHKRCEKNENGDFCQTSASCGEGFGFTDEDKCGACIPLVECLGCPDHSIGTCDCEKCSGGFNDVFGIRADSECSVAPNGECNTEYGHCQGRDYTSYIAQSTGIVYTAPPKISIKMDVCSMWNAMRTNSSIPILMNVLSNINAHPSLNALSKQQQLQQL